MAEQPVPLWLFALTVLSLASAVLLSFMVCCQLQQCNKELRLYQEWLHEAAVRVRALEADIHRLKDGLFTEEEFQNLCHNFSADDAERFRKGCQEYQRKLFGEQPRLPEKP